MIRNQWNRCVPVPKKAQLQPEGICLDNTWGISDLEKYPEVRKRWRESFRLSDSLCEKNITFVTENIGTESYRISIGDDLLKVTAGGETGFNYALDTL